MKNLLVILTLSISVWSFAQDDPFKTTMDNSWNSISESTFPDLLKSNDIVFSMPEGFEKTKVTRNYNVFYQYAIKDKHSNFEIRIFIKSFKDIFKDTSSFNPNKFSFSFLSGMALNASGNVMPDIPQIDLFPQEGVKQEFNADWGGTTAFVPKSEFGKGFSFCALNCLRKNDKCEVYIFYMFDDVPNQQALMQKGFYVITFSN